MTGKLTEEDKKHITMLLNGKPLPEGTKNKEWIENHVKMLLEKCKTSKSKKLF